MIAVLVTLVAALSSCKKNDQAVSSGQNANVASLPAKAVSYVGNNYPDATIDYVLIQKSAAAPCIAVLNTTEELAFTSAGDYLGNGLLYHHGNHGGDTIHWDTIHCDTVHGGGHHGGGHHGGPHGNGIPVDSLPLLITDYISAHFSGYTIMHARYDTLCPEGAVKEVMIVAAGTEPVKLLFGAGDVFLMQASRVLYATLPQQVKDYITANYTGYQPCYRSEKLNLAGNVIQYSVYARSGSSRVKVRLMEDGTLVCVQ